jgi:gas vesicle protein
VNDQTLERLGFFFLGVALGAALGTALALLFAPQSGEETRRQIVKKSTELRGLAQESSAEFLDRVRQATEEWAEKLQEAADDLLARGRTT